MKIAVSTDYGNVSAHFGRCAFYTIYDIENNQILSKSEIPNPGHQPGFLPQFLSERGVNWIIAGGMGPRAQGLFAQQNIETVLGVQGEVDDVIQKFLNHELEAGVDLCDHGSEGHGSHACDHEQSDMPPLQVSNFKICVTSQGPDLDASVDPKFGRANYFLLIDPKTFNVESVKNQNKEAVQGAGIQAAQLMAEKNVGIVFTGECGPKASQILQSAGIQIKTHTSGRVRDVVETLKSV